MKRGIRILLGAVPFGENNVGDEAILECVLGIVRSAAPEADIAVSTHDREATAAKLGVRTVPLFGFERPHTPSELTSAMSDADVFIWSGATGLSDYPENAVALLNAARAAGAKTALWNVGMNAELNPAKYRVLPGRRRRLLESVTRLSKHRLDAIALQEAHWQAHARRRVKEGVDAADLVVTRDYPSRDELLRCGVSRPIWVGADSAIRTPTTPLEQLTLPEEARRILEGPERKVGVCISAQREVRQRRDLVQFLDQLVEDGTTRILFIPMNPITDASLMAGLQREMKYPERTGLVSGRYEPADISAISSRLDVVISSRLHLLILASIHHVPLIGIARGSKVDNYLAPYGLRPAGSVDVCRFPELYQETQRLLAERESFERVSRRVFVELERRLTEATAQLEQLLSSV